LGVKVLAAFFLVLMSGTVVLAKPSPFEPRQSMLVNENAAAQIGHARKRMESSYFRAQPAPSNATGKLMFQCRLDIFAKTRLAQTCN
jgi:hypothetical protein